MRTVLVSIIAVALAASPASAQIWGRYVGPAVGWVDGDISEEPIAGIDVGVWLQDFTARYPELRIEVRYVHRRSGDNLNPELLHTFQIPALYKVEFDALHYLLLGSALSFSRDDGQSAVDVSAMVGGGIDIAHSEKRILSLEIAYNVGLPYVISGLDFGRTASLQGLSLRLATRGR